MTKELNEIVNDTESVFDIDDVDLSFRAFGKRVDKMCPVDTEEDEIDYEFEYDNDWGEEDELNFDE